MRLLKQLKSLKESVMPRKSQNTFFTGKYVVGILVDSIQIPQILFSRHIMQLCLFMIAFNMGMTVKTGTIRISTVNFGHNGLKAL